ncbi:MAG TPA: polysaccharide biosynthesis tyrosine autokinase [Bacteroidales bacterium]|nr:polysaccharide biosynthesis tyrosine autokinase [Bacteroidales bacterium]
MKQQNKIPFLNQKFDPRTFFTIFKKNFWVIIIIGVVSVGVGFAYYRYTLPVFKATSILQIKNENKTNQILGINNVGMETDLAPVIELIRSHEFLKTVVATLPLEISYYRQGTFLSTELYGSTPFEVKYRLNNPVILDQNIICEFVDYKCHLSYEINGEIYEYRINPEEWQSVFGMEILIHFPTKKDMEIELDADNKSQYYFTINDPNTVLYRISANLNIQVLNETAGTILITYYDYNASKAADITNTIAEKFIEFDGTKKKESANNIINYIDQQMENVFAQLNLTERDLHDFRVQNNIKATNDNVLFNKANLYTSKISELETKLLNIDFEIMTLEKIAIKIKSEPELKTYEILAMLSGQQSETFLSEMINSLQELLSRKEILLFDVTANNHKIKVIDEQIQSKKDIIVDFVNSTILRLGEEKTEYAKRINEIESQVFVDSSYDEIEYARLMRLYAINEDFYSQLIQTKAETMISQAGYVSVNLILEKASVPAYPDYPALRKVFMLSVIIAFVISAMFILLKYLLYNKILSTVDISEYTDIPVIGGVPEAKLDMSVSQVVVHKRPKSMMAEAFRSIRNNLDFYPIKDKCRVITVSSTIAGEGKTFVGINIAAIYAMTGKRVLIMDFDLRKPRLDKCFSVSNLKGVSTILIKKHNYEECLHNSEIENLHFITSGPLPPNPAELILGKNLVNLVDEVKKDFDVVIIDTPPVGIVTDALVTYRLAHNPIYVMRASISPKSFISNVDSFAQDSKLDNLGIILNGIERSTSRYGYGYKSGYGYQYGYRSYGYGYGYLTKIHNSYYGEEVETKYLIFNRLINRIKKLKK